MPDYFALKNAGFEHALIGLRHRHLVAREGWDGAWLALQPSDEQAEESQPGIYLCASDGSREPWTASQDDILATDWLTVR